MSANDLIFTHITGDTVLEPITLTESADGYFGVESFGGFTAYVHRLRVTNGGQTQITDIGAYIRPCTNLADSTYNTRVNMPYNAWQTMLYEGSFATERIDSGESFEDNASGLILQVAGGDPIILHWGRGDNPNNKADLGIPVLLPGHSFDLTVGWIFKRGVGDLDLSFVDLVLE